MACMFVYLSFRDIHLRTVIVYKCIVGWESVCVSFNPCHVSAVTRGSSVRMVLHFQSISPCVL